MHTHMHPAIMMMAMTKMMTKKIMAMMIKMIHVALEGGGCLEKGGVSKRGVLKSTSSRLETPDAYLLSIRRASCTLLHVTCTFGSMHVCPSTLSAQCTYAPAHCRLDARVPQHIVGSMHVGSTPRHPQRCIGPQHLDTSKALLVHCWLKSHRDPSTSRHLNDAASA